MYSWCALDFKQIGSILTDIWHKKQGPKLMNLTIVDKIVLYGKYMLQNIFVSSSLSYLNFKISDLW